MDGEGIISLIIIILAVVWNIISKIRDSVRSGEREPIFVSSGNTKPPQDKVESIYLTEQDIEHPPVSFQPPRMKKKKSGAGGMHKPVAARSAGQDFRRPAYSVNQLRKAIIWSEILAPPVALRDE